MSASPSTIEEAKALSTSSSPVQETGFPVIFAHLYEATLPEIRERDPAYKDEPQAHHITGLGHSSVPTAPPHNQHGHSEHEQGKPEGQISLQLHVPERFAQVVQGIYRSSFPESGHLDIFKALGVKTIVRFVDEEYSPPVKAFMLTNNVRALLIPIIPNKDVCVKTTDQTVNKVMNVLMDRNNQPLVLHCNQGKHRTGSMAGCLRKLQGWSHPEIVEEDRSFAGLKSRILDEMFIEAYKPGRGIQKTAKRLNVKRWARVPDQLSEDAAIERPVLPLQ
ncbi:uncharacterized protein N7496_008049 [Penicillium cataractarum]|uniref:Tyrosine specific protein phosphatases domain-containing protein n=1 Tax=Penicillium cataractarum TaxID=2100454 RepID=A0A9W9V5D0_9EURO|nr:uncharacterized protein N7496_008049 [Penicillium cataractarum]KAJ5368289.1 hypothetical protein N7496_008049 [Penicillium cataractarum]